MKKTTNPKCTLCGNILSFRYKAMSQWNISGDLCGECYGKKLTEHYISTDQKIDRTLYFN
jgi:hypothetical protein